MLTLLWVGFEPVPTTNKLTKAHAFSISHYHASWGQRSDVYLHSLYPLHSITLAVHNLIKTMQKVDNLKVVNNEGRILLMRK